MDEFASIEVKGERWMLLPEKAVWWPARHTLLVADTHFGKAATFRKAGIPVPGGTTAAMLARLSGIIQRTAVQRLIVLGDLVHSPTRADQDFEAELISWRTGLAGLDIVLLAGNHDRGHSRLFDALGIHAGVTQLTEPPFFFCHDGRTASDRVDYAVSGHLHPAIRNPDPWGTQRRLPCFWFGEAGALLPAFGEFTGNTILEREAGDQVFAIADGCVVPIGPRGGSRCVAG
jgi:DNA ligase-associated metallophosphoesterase